MLPINFSPCEAIYQQIRRWLRVECFEAMTDDLRSIIRAAQARQGQLSAVILDGRTFRPHTRAVRVQNATATNVSAVAKRI